MNIQAINNQTSFKAIYKPIGVEFSESQKKVIKDIENKVNPNEDFYVEYGTKRDSVELSKLGGFTKDALKSEKTGWQKQIYIGTYDENKLFPIEDLKTAEKEQKKKDILGTITGVVIIGMMLTIILGTRNNAKTKDVIPTVKEQVVNPIKDSLQKVGKDTLNLTKQLLKK